MRIIGHRGAAGLALENSIASIKAAKKAGVDAIEFDVRPTSDGHFVLSHDKTTKRVSPKKRHVLKSKLRELKKSMLHNKEEIATLSAALAACGSTPAIIEPKDGGWAKELAKDLAAVPKKPANISVIAFDHDELARFSKLYPKAATYGLDRTSPFDAIYSASLHHFDGIDISFWLLNPLSYYLARRKGLDIVVFTVNYAWLAKLIRFLYPEVAITTNYPDKLQFLRNKN